MERRGYTLIEMLVVLAIVAVLASIAMPVAELTVQRQKEAELKRALWELRDAIDAYRQARESGAVPGETGRSSLPPDLLALTQQYRDARADRAGQPLRFLRRVPRDPFAPVTVPAEQTWGLRSYLSESDRPEPGDDVYDVYSRSDKTGLNGVPLRQW